MDLDTEARIIELAYEIEKLISENFAKERNETVQRRVKEIKEEIRSYGFEITWEATLNSKDLSKLDVNVQIWKPKKNLSPEDQKIYDDWFKNVNKITA